MLLVSRALVVPLVIRDAAGPAFCNLLLGNKIGKGHRTPGPEVATFDKDTARNPLPFLYNLPQLAVEFYYFSLYHQIFFIRLQFPLFSFRFGC